MDSPLHQLASAITAAKKRFAAEISDNKEDRFFIALIPPPAFIDYLENDNVFQEDIHSLTEKFISAAERLPSISTAATITASTTDEAWKNMTVLERSQWAAAVRVVYSSVEGMRKHDECAMPAYAKAASKKLANNSIFGASRTLH